MKLISKNALRAFASIAVVAAFFIYLQLTSDSEWAICEQAAEHVRLCMDQYCVRPHGQWLCDDPMRVGTAEFYTVRRETQGEYGPQTIRVCVPERAQVDLARSCADLTQLWESQRRAREHRPTSAIQSEMEEIFRSLSHGPSQGTGQDSE
jgi:hypothetical protein